MSAVRCLGEAPSLREKRGEGGGVEEQEGARSQRTFEGLASSSTKSADKHP